MANVDILKQSIVRLAKERDNWKKAYRQAKGEQTEICEAYDSDIRKLRNIIEELKKPELHNCPFCGGKAEFVNFADRNPQMLQSVPACKIRCAECGASIPEVISQDSTFTYKDLAQERWNRRCD